MSYIVKFSYFIDLEVTPHSLNTFLLSVNNRSPIWSRTSANIGSYGHDFFGLNVAMLPSFKFY